MLRTSADRRPSGFVEPCRPSKATAPPSGPEWVHEIKHDGFRLMVWREGSRVRCFTRGGFDWADRFPAIVEAASCLRPQSFLIDGEVIVCRPDGLSDFDALRYRRDRYSATLVAFDLIQLQDDDLREEPLLKRKQRLSKMLGNGGGAIAYNEHLEHDGPAVFEHACRLGLEGIVSKRLDAPYRSGPSKTWLKSKNPLSEAVRREREEDWDRGNW
jgi:bifunctional non-homologous end joining protein LigD